MKDPIHIQFSKLDSDRFNLNIFRAVAEKADPVQLAEELEKNKADVLILRMPVESKASQHWLTDLHLPFIHADTLVHYKLDLGTYQPQKLKNRLSFSKINDRNARILEYMIPLIFKGYKNHYFSNPLFDAAKIQAGYVEWGRSYAVEGAANKIGWIAELEGEPAAFANCSFNGETGLCEGILFGVLPEFEGRGIYADLIKFTASYFKTEGFKWMDVSTQIQNFAVQKAWTRQGFTIHKAFDTYHINSLFGRKHLHL